MLPRIAAVPTLVLLAGLGACIDDPVDVDDQFALSQEDAELLGLTVWRHALEVQLDLDVGRQASSARPALAPQRTEETTTVTDTSVVACTLGGEMERIMVASLTIDVEADLLEVSADLTLAHDACREEIDGEAFSFYGAPALEVGMTDRYGPGDARTLSGYLEGGVVVITRGAPLLCEASVAVENGVVEGDSITYRVRGHFCGSSVDEVVTEPLD